MWKQYSNQNDKAKPQEKKKMDISNLPGKEFKIMVKNLLTKKSGEEWTNMRISTKRQKI